MTVSKGQASPYTKLQDWYGSPLGRKVARIEAECVQTLLNQIFGYYLVQIGQVDVFRDALASSRIRHQVMLSSDLSGRHEGLETVGQDTALPFASDSIDAILLPHTLDFTPSPRQVLGEVERVLIPEGRVVIVGFNAMSAWGLRKLLSGTAARMPWCGRFSTLSQVNDWLAVAGFTVEVHEYLVFCPPFQHRQVARWTPVETLGRRFWPLLGGVYVVRAIKRVSTLTPLKTSWNPRPVLLPPTAIRPTTTRGTGHA